MKKRIILGDPHGNYKIIESIYKNERPDMVIILGDYCDSFVHGTPEIVAAYKKMRKLQNKHVKTYGDGSFITLLGNHDWHYIMFGERYSGFHQSTWNAMHDMLDSDMTDGRLPIVWVDNRNKTIYSHAGLTNTWMSDWRIPSPEFVNEVNDSGLNFSHMSFEPHGNSKWQGPLWVRPMALISDLYGRGEWKQIVGHTRTNNGKPVCIGLHGDNVWQTYKEDAVVFVMDTLPFYYMRETLDDEGNLVNRELVNNMEFDPANLPQ